MKRRLLTLPDYDFESCSLPANLLNRAEGRVEGRAEGKAEIICQYLEDRFGAESQALQETVRAITELEVLSRITNQIFVVNHLDEAVALIQVSPN